MSIDVWLAEQMRSFGLNQSELAKKAHLNQAAISRLLSNQAIPTPETCQALARVFHVPVDEVYIAAGILPQKPDRNPLDDKINYLISTLPTEEDKQEVLRYVELRLKIAEERGRFPIEKHPKPAHP